MTKRSRVSFLLIMVMALCLVLSGVSFAKSKAVKMTPDEMNILVSKFKTSNPAFTPNEACMNSTCGHGEKVHRKIMGKMKAWDKLTTKASDEKISQKKRDKMKARAEKIAAAICLACEKMNASDNSKKCEPAVNVVPGQYQPKTEKGRQTMELFQKK